MSVAAELGANRYGKSRVRLVKVVRENGRSEIYDWTIEVMLEGDFRAVFVDGNNTGLLTTDAMKNVVYSLARSSTASTMEAFARELAGFLLKRDPQLTSADVSIEEALWKRLAFDGKADAASFMRGSNEYATVQVTLVRDQAAQTVSGFRDMVLLKTANSGFAGFQRDPHTTLPETDDRLLGTAMSARWTYMVDPGSCADARARIREALLRTFAAHHSKSVQHTLFAMGEAALAAASEIDAITLVMPNRHYIPVDLSRFGQDNPNQIFVATEEPHGTIEAEVRRK